MGEPGLVRQSDIDRNFVQIRQSKAMLAKILADLEHVLLAQIGDDVDRVELGDLGQRGLLAPAADDIAGIDQVLADDAVERRPDLGIAEVQLGERDARLGSE